MCTILCCSSLQEASSNKLHRVLTCRPMEFQFCMRLLRLLEVRGALPATGATSPLAPGPCKRSTLARSGSSALHRTIRHGAHSEALQSDLVSFSYLCKTAAQLTSSLSTSDTLGNLWSIHSKAQCWLVGCKLMEIVDFARLTRLSVHYKVHEPPM